jgi:hypothetical protein
MEFYYQGMYWQIHVCFYQKGRMEKTIDTMRTNFNSVRTGRANPSMLDKIEVQACFCVISFVIHMWLVCRHCIMYAFYHVFAGSLLRLID